MAATVDGSTGRQLTNFTSLKIYSYQWSPDGKCLAMVRGDSPSDLVLIKDSSENSKPCCGAKCSPRTLQSRRRMMISRRF